MKSNTLICLAVMASSFAADAQSNIDWSTIDGGGGTSTGGVYSVTGTIGQPDAAWPVDQNGFAVPATGGNYTLIGGFWSILQKSGRPPLKIKQQAGQLVLSWPADAPGVVLQSATQLAPTADWSNFAGTPVRVGDEFQLIVGPANTPPSPIRFFRLCLP